MSYVDLPAWVDTGATFRMDFGPDNLNSGRLFHVRGIVDGRAIVREWSRRKQRWLYSVIGPVEFEVFGEHYKPGRRR